MTKRNDPPTMDDILSSIRRIIAEEPVAEADTMATDVSNSVRARSAKPPDTHGSPTVKQSKRGRVSNEPVPGVEILPDFGETNDLGRLVFISHANADASRASAIVKFFENRGLKCWIAPRDIPPGSNFHAEIARAIDNCTDLILIYSKNSNDSRHVKRELHLGFEQDKPTIPVRFDDTELSNELRYLLAGTQWATATDPGALLKLFSDDR